MSFAVLPKALLSTLLNVLEETRPTELSAVGESLARKHKARTLPLLVGVRRISTPLSHSCRHSELFSSSPMDASSFPVLLKASRGTPRTWACWILPSTSISFEFL